MVTPGGILIQATSEMPAGRVAKDLRANILQICLVCVSTPPRVRARTRGAGLGSRPLQILFPRMHHQASSVLLFYLTTFYVVLFFTPFRVNSKMWKIVSSNCNRILKINPLPKRSQLWTSFNIIRSFHYYHWIDNALNTLTLKLL